MDETPSGTAPEEATEREVAVVAANLIRWKPMLKDQRLVKFDSPVLAQIVNDSLRDDAAREAATRFWADRELRLAELERQYGEAVRRVPGALVEDLFNLYKMGLLLTQVGTNDDSAHFDACGRTQELKELVERFRDDLNRGEAGLRIEASRGPLDIPLDEAIELKRNGKYLESARIYIDLCVESRVAYVGWLVPLYKTVASAGDLADAWLLLRDMRDSDPTIPDIADHIPRFVEALYSGEALEEYLTQIAGTASYALPRDYTSMLDELRARVSSDSHPGNADIWIAFGRMDDRDRGPREAIVFYEKAARTGSLEGMRLLGLTFLSLREDREAVQWLTMPAESGDPAVMFLLADAYRHLEEPIQALHWYTKAADAGSSQAMVGLAFLHGERGDANQSVVWLRKAVEAGEREPGVLISLASALHKHGDKAEATRWYTTAAEAGDARAMIPLTHYALDSGDINKAKLWAKRAAAGQQPDGLAFVGNYYVDREDYAEGARWILEAADEGSDFAQRLLTAMPGLRNPANLARVQTPTKAPQRNGCYIATAVYGSYDAPPVVSLRRFRDERLARSTLGRLLIRWYYAVSPSLAHNFAGATRLNRFTKIVLDSIVRTVDRS